MTILPSDTSMPNIVVQQRISVQSAIASIAPTARARAPRPAVDGIEFRSERISSSLVIVYVRGDVDLSTMPALREHVRSQIAGNRKLVLDLSELDFIGTDGLAVLADLDARDGAAGWALVGGRAVNRLLRAADLSTRYRAFDSLDSALCSLRAIAG
jgi:anti-sigma B factor antagonist